MGRHRTARWLGTGLALALAGAVLALVGAWSGIVNISASAGHPAWVESFLELGMRRSVERNSRDLVPPADLDSPARIQLGAAHFAGGCAECHGEPGAPRNPIYDYMLPFPPDLTSAANDWNARELFFIVRHGLQFTGMPEWSGGARDDEVWSVVAFLLQLPTLDAGDYRVLASGNRDMEAVTEEAIGDAGVAQLARTACDRCHDTAQSAPTSAFVPWLAGQPEAFIARSLREYKRGIRRSGFMQPVAAMLEEPQIEALAAYYSAMPRAESGDSPAQQAVTPQLSANQPGNAAGQQRDAAGQQQDSDTQHQEAAAIASGTHPELRLPACLSCHRRSARADYPLLAGQQAAYIAQQLRLFRSGGRKTSAWGDVMSVIAARLDDEHIDPLAQWFAQQAGTDAE